jgi:SAM-dependent methyltransferase
MNDIIFRIGSGESTGIQSSTMDAVLIGSAFHWMHPQQCRDEMIRILKPKGVLRIFEYQFPKTQELPELNEWIRRQFNLNWKADNQKPRGSFFQITDVFRTDARFTPISSRKPPMMINLTADDLAGLIFSQSRVLCYEGKLSDTEKVKFREEVRHVLNLFLQERAVTFDFNLSWFEFGLTCDS